MEFTFIPANEHSVSKSQQGHKPSSWLPHFLCSPLPAYIGMAFEEVSQGKLWLQTTLCFYERSYIPLHSDYGRLEAGWELGWDNWI